MHFIYGLPVCPPLCPPLGNDDLISSSEENLDHQRKFLPDHKLSKYAKQIRRRLIFSTPSRKENFSDDKDIDEEFDQISLSDNYYVSLLKQILFKIG